ncbi:MAG: Membrane protein [Devosia sp.]|nr:Membrane protein [Devosia sp.]
MAEVMADEGNGLGGHLGWAGFAIGFGLGGFFDGILLHQVLQWHHLLSGLEQARQDLRVLVMTDGLFHVLMYLVTAVGLWLLWRSRQHFAQAGADRILFAFALLGFGGWHLVDAVLSHWILGIHRIRMDVDNPLFWDLLWVGVFGILPVIAGLLLRRRAGGGRRLTSSPLALVLAVAIGAPLAALPPPDQSRVMVLFRPGVTPGEAFSAIQEAQGRLVWSDPSGQLWAVDLSSGGDRVALYRNGALLVSNAIVPLGCLDWMRA